MSDFNLKKIIDNLINLLKHKRPNDYIINNYLDEKIKLFNINTYNDKYSRKIVKNYINNSNINNQKYFNYIIGGTINLCKELLELDSSTIKKKLEDRYSLILGLNILKNNLKKLNYSLYKFYLKRFKRLNFILDYNHLLYIFFYVIPRTRRFIEILKGESEYSYNYGTIQSFKLVFNSNNDYHAYHSFNMKRFVNYNRLEIILNNIYKSYKNTLEIINIEKFTKKSKLYIEIFGFASERSFNSFYQIYENQCFPKIYDVKIINYITYIIKLDISIDFFNSEDIFGKYLINIYNKLKDTSDMKIKFYTYNNTVRRLVYGIKDSRSTLCDNEGNAAFYNFIGNKSKLYKNVSRLLLILLYCLNLLKSKDIRDTILLTIENDMDKIKKIIIIFYYLFIYLMAFKLGTAAIAEISLFTLWDKYVNFYGNEPLIINQNIMLDVEVLSSQFSKFYTNCFNQESEDDIYTPYFISTINNSVNNSVNNPINNSVNNLINNSVKN